MQPLFDDAALRGRYQSGRYAAIDLLRRYRARFGALLNRHSFDLLWIEKEALPWAPLWLEFVLLRGRPFVLDYDDAIFHNYDMHRSAWVRRLYGRRIDGLMAKAALVIGGNSYLAERANGAGTRRVEVMPTVIDLERYPISRAPKAAVVDGRPRVVWIGSPTTAQYLATLQEPLHALSRRVPFVLRVIGLGNGWSMPGVEVEVLPWSEATEVADITSADVGVMPLPDSPWERGKCGYKLIQYMACALPVVASRVGANREIVQDGVSGFLAVTSQQWVNTLERLLTDGELRTSMGLAGRERVEASYCIQQTGPRMVELLTRAAQGV